MQTILLIDFNNFVWKGCVDFKGSNDQSYVVVFNFFRNLVSLIKQFYPTKIFLCGEGGKTFRHDLYSGYKANRLIKLAEEMKPANKDKFYKQLNIIWDISEYFPFQRVFANGFEADDVIYALMSDLKNEDVVIVSNDSDFIQILQKKDFAKTANIYNPFTHQYVEAPKYHYLTYKICAGDKADNIPAILSAKKAEKLASDPKSLASFLDKSPENLANYNLNKALIELTDISLDKLTFLPYNIDYEIVAREFAKMKFNSFLRDYKAFVEVFSYLQ